MLNSILYSFTLLVRDGLDLLLEWLDSHPDEVWDNGLQGSAQYMGQVLTGSESWGWEVGIIGSERACDNPVYQDLPLVMAFHTYAEAYAFAEGQARYAGFTKTA